MHIRKSSTSVLTALIGVIALVMLAVWQFYLFVVFKESSGIANAPGGMLHLWLAIGITLIACISFFVFSIFLRHDRDDELNITS
jgi:uncharacterized membrane protein